MAAITGMERDTRLRTVMYLTGGTLTALIILVPLAFELLRSAQPSEVISSAPDSHTFFNLTLDNFTTLFAHSNLGRSVLNSLIVSLGTAALTAALALFAGYGFSKFRFRLSPVLFAAILLSMMIPFQAILVPLYLQLNIMHLTDSLLGLIFFYSTVNLPFGVFVMRNSFAALPADLEDSGRVDGAGTMRTLFSVLWPLVVPGVATSALFAFLRSWTEFIGALVFLTSPNLFTLPVNLVNLQQGAYGEIDYGLLAAGAVVSMIPCIILYAALQRYYVRGLMSGAVKG